MIPATARNDSTRGPELDGSRHGDGPAGRKRKTTVSMIDNNPCKELILAERKTRLADAAPDLLDAAKAALEWIGDTPPLTDGYSSPYRESVMAVRSKLTRAIAKAKG